jgi:hypothetical protein
VVILYGSSLLFEGFHSLTFGQIGSILQIQSKPALASYLHQLTVSGIVEKSPVKDENQRVFPVYSLSEKGKNFLRDFGLEDLIQKRINDLKLKG